LYDPYWLSATPGFTLWSVKRVTKKIFIINDRIKDIDRELALTRAELEFHRSINEDAQRDAAVGNYIDREEAGLTRGDVRRFERTIDKLEARKMKLKERRASMLDQLPD
jgi:hypothetical protein